MDRFITMRWYDLVTTILVTAVFGVMSNPVSHRWRVSEFCAAKPTLVKTAGGRPPRGMVWIPGGEFLMGSTDRLAKPNERPAHIVRVHGFWMDQSQVTNAQFAAFVTATGYVTTAERTPDWRTLRKQLPVGIPKPSDSKLVPGALVFVGTDHPVDLTDYSQWWAYVPGANWRHPQGPTSSIDGERNHPVVQVSYEDALAYAHWARKRLPTEAEWEFAARGGLDNKTYAWGDERSPNGKKMANIWDESNPPFPETKRSAEESHGTKPVCSFPRNGYGLCDMAGNVWQWVADWYREDAYAHMSTDSVTVDPKGPSESYDTDDPTTPRDAPKRTIRGGSFLCSEEYCLGYRVSARRGSDPYTSMSHLGFRLVSN